MAREKNRQPETPPDQQPPEPAKTAPELPDAGQNVEVSTSDSDPAEQKKTDESSNKEQSEATDKNDPSPERSSGDKTTDVENEATDKAVDDIAAHEADTMLAVQDALGRKHSQPDQPGWKSKLKKILKSRRTWAAVCALILLLLLVPATRYRLLGLVVKKQVSITVTDSKTDTPVSFALVTVHGAQAKTDAEGKASLKVPPGPTRLVVNKQYYKTYDKPFMVGLGGKGSKDAVEFVATGRQVPVTVLNTITGQPLKNAEVTVLKTAAKTDKQGKATIVLPADKTAASGTVSAKNYNTAKVTIQITNKVIPANNFNLTPAGHVYFLSNVGGGMNVVKTNLDGSGSQIVLEATGKEDNTTMTLLATRDWRYLALKSRRDTAQPVLYLIDTKDDKVTQFDSNNGTFNPIGWYGHSFMYDFVSATVPQEQNGHEVLKSYDADHQQLNQLDQSQATDGVHQDFFNFYVLNNQLVYNTQWYSDGGSLDGKNASIRGVDPDGRDKKDYQTFAAAGLAYVLAAPYQPQAIYYDAYNGTSTYYNFASQTVNTVSLDQSYFKRNYPTYLLSPSGSQTLWSDQQNGQDTIFISDKNAQHPKQLAGFDDYKPYGWYTDDYILLSKGGTELYIAPAAGLKPGKQPLKISYYYKPIQSYPNYGYGYGGQ